MVCGYSTHKETDKSAHCAYCSKRGRTSRMEFWPTYSGMAWVCKTCFNAERRRCDEEARKLEYERNANAGFEVRYSNGVLELRCGCGVMVSARIGRYADGDSTSDISALGSALQEHLTADNHANEQTAAVMGGLERVLQHMRRAVDTAVRRRSDD